MKRIIYPTPEGGIAVIIPTGAIEDCIKDVPNGLPYEIVNTSDIPSDRTFRGAWQWQQPEDSSAYVPAIGTYEPEGAEMTDQGDGIFTSPNAVAFGE